MTSYPWQIVFYPLPISHWGAPLQKVPTLKDKYQHYNITLAIFIIFLVFAIRLVDFDGVMEYNRDTAYGSATDEKQKGGMYVQFTTTV